MSDDNACISCGACCASYRVSFYWGELASAGGEVPDDLTAKAGHHRSCMLGTAQKQPRCVALVGTVGEAVSCSIYPNRPTPCREFEANNSAINFNPDCDKARARHGLPPLLREDIAS